MVSLGLMRVLRDRGLRVGPFKTGPDYIDTQFHALACDAEMSANLDLFMGSAEHAREVFALGAAGCDAAVVEGAMGLFDGYDRGCGSAAEVAKALRLPVVLVIDASSTAFSVAATIYGFTRFDREVNVAGVIFNKVASDKHRGLLEEAARAAGAVPLGFIGRSEGLLAPSRHLGLALDGRTGMERFVAMAAREVARGVDVDRLLELTEFEDPAPAAEREMPEPRFVAAVARDEAFNFIYGANLRSLRRSGAEIKFFSPLRSKRLPENTELVYLPGGYPELWAGELAGNVEMRRTVRDFGEAGGRILAECGGLIYLGREIDGHDMCGLLPTVATMEGARLTLGYRHVSTDAVNLKGHEFHYSRLVNPDALPSVAAQTDARHNPVNTPLYRYKNCFAGYTHLYWGETDIMDLWK